MADSRKKGYSLIELMFVMTLLILFGLTTFTLVVSGSNTYNRLTESKNENSELRIAISYVKMEIRQNDMNHTISVQKSPIGSGKALVLEMTIDKDHYEKWIYCNNGKLKEAYVKKGLTLNDSLSTEIAEISGFDPTITVGGIKISVSKAFGKGSKEYSTVIALNSEQQGGTMD